MKHASLTLFFCTIVLSLSAQAPQPGQLVLNSQATIEGEVDINAFINSAVVTTPDGRQLTYHASMIDEISTVDECDRVRTYRCYDYRSSSFFDRLEKKLFHVVEDGNITLLRRLFEYDVFDADDEYTVEEWYYLDGDKVRRLRNFKRQIMPLMVDHADEMQEFKQRNRLRNLNKDVNMFLMVSHYNTISRPEGQTLSRR